MSIVLSSARNSMIFSCAWDIFSTRINGISYAAASFFFEWCPFPVNVMLIYICLAFAAFLVMVHIDKEYIAQNNDLANKNDLTALFRIGYGLYVVTSNDGKKDNGLIVNTVTQLTDTPNRVAVNINKKNYSHHIIKQTGIMNVNCLSVDAPFSVFQQFGFQTGRSVDKFAGQKICRSDNGLVFLDKYINAFMSLKVEQYVDLGTHGMFICSVTEARVMNDLDTMTYTYYQKNVKPRPQTEGKKGFVCKVCGYIYEGDELPEDFICPLCKHGVIDFEPIK